MQHAAAEKIFAWAGKEGLEDIYRGMYEMSCVAVTEENLPALLEKDGYRTGEDLEAMLDRLGLRLRTEGDFPHEIGLFLGYPPEDVAGFQRHRGRNCKLCGYWKVYSDVDRAKALFRRYDQCRERLCARLAAGQSLRQILQAA